MIANSGEHRLPASGCRKHLDKRLREWSEASRQTARDGHAGSVCSPELTNSTAPQSVALPANDPRDLTPGDHDVPPFHFGGQDMYAISPDGQEVASEEYVSPSSTSAMCVDRQVAWLFPYCRNVTLATLEQVAVPASHTR